MPDAGGAPRQRLYLIDGSGYIFRAFHALPPMSRPDGTPVNAVYGFCNMLVKLLEDMKADRLAVVFDAGHVSFRNEIYQDYKANRDAPPDELIPQFGLIREAVRAFAIPCIEKEGFEADDIIATYCRAATAEGTPVTIVSSDKDLMQLVSDTILMFDPMKLRDIGPEEVRERFGVGPEKVIEVQALAGDSIDNVPGVPGIGVKTGAQLINEYGSLDELLARAHEIRQPKRRENLIAFAEQARISRELVRLKDDVPLDDGVGDFAVRRPDPEVLLGFLREQGFRALTARVERKLVDGGAEVAAPAPSPTAAERRYEIVDSEEALGRWIARAMDAGTVALGFEPVGVALRPTELCGIALALGAGQACYVPLGHCPPDAGDLMDRPEPPRQLERRWALDRLAPLLGDPSVLKVVHNAKPAMRLLARFGVRLAPVDDTMLLSYVLDGTRYNHMLEDLAEAHLAHKPMRREELVGKGKALIGFEYVALPKALDFAAEVADVAGRLHALYRRRLTAEHMTAIYETIERPLVPVLADMEAAGIRVEPVQLRELSRDLSQRIAGLEDEIYRLAGREFTIGSPKQVGDVLFKDQGIDGGRKSKTGAFSTGADILEEMADQGNELAARILDWRQLTKLKTTYADALLEEIDPETERIHTTFAMTVASTGRLSSNDPNLQNIPVRTEEGRKIRRAFVAAPGTVLLSADYSQIELRLLAHVAEMEVLREAFRAGLDIHALTASQVFGLPVEGMDPLVRRKAKAINFGIIYGISPFGLGRQLGIPQAEAREYIVAYFERYPGIRAYMEKAKEFARRHGFVTTIFGRKCLTPSIRDSNPSRRSFAERAAINAPLQGSAADIIKRAMVRIPGALDRAGLGARMLLQVHDELLFEVPEAEVGATASLVRDVMERAASLSVPLVADTGVAKDWASAH